MPDKARVYLIEGADLRHQSYAHLLGAAGYEVTRFDSARAFIEIAPLVATGCILDLHGSGFDGHPPPADISARRSDLPVIVMSADEGDVTLAVRMIKGGASDFLEMSCSDAQLLAAIAGALDAAAHGRQKADEAVFSASRIAEMSTREREVLERLLGGGTNKTIAKALGISPRTVEIHRAHVMERLGAHNLSEAIRMALAAGLEPTPPSSDDARTTP